MSMDVQGSKTSVYAQTLLCNLFFIVCTTMSRMGRSSGVFKTHSNYNQFLVFSGVVMDPDYKGTGAPSGQYNSVRFLLRVSMAAIIPICPQGS